MIALFRFFHCLSFMLSCISAFASHHEQDYLKFDESFWNRVSSLFTTRPNEPQGSIISYHLAKIEGTRPGATFSSGIMVHRNLVITTAHSVKFKISPGDSAAAKAEKEEFLKDYEDTAFEVHFYDAQGHRFIFERHAIPQQFDTRFLYKGYDIAILYNEDDFPHVFSYKITVPPDQSDDADIELIGYVIEQTTEQTSVDRVMRTRHQVMGTVKFTGNNKIEGNLETYASMSGSSLYQHIDDTWIIFGIHGYGDGDRKKSQREAAPLFRFSLSAQESKSKAEKPAQSCAARLDYHFLLNRYSLFSKIDLWQQLNVDYQNPPLDRWRPVLFSVQTDGDQPWQEAFIDELRLQMQTACKEHSIKISDIFSEAFFAFSGKGKDTLEEFKAISLKDNFTNHAGMEAPLPSVFIEPISQDMTLQGIEQLQRRYPDTPPIVIALGISSNSEEVHEEIIDNVKIWNFIYHRISYLHFMQGSLGKNSPLREESYDDYYRKIEDQARLVTELLIQNYLLKYPPALQKEEPLFMPITTTESISASLKSDLALSNPLSSAIIYS